MSKTEESVNEWLTISLYDLKTAKVMLDAGRYLYVAFMCQQAIEKLLKARFVQKMEKLPPRTHNLLYLLDKLELNILEDKRKFFAQLNNFYLESRYPGDRIKLSEEIDKTSAKEIYLKTKEAWECLKQLFP